MPVTADERPATPTLDRRLERLEREFAEFDKDVALIKAEQVHVREFVAGEFTGLKLSLARIEGTVAAAQTLIQTASTDPAGSPLGRSLTGDINAAQLTANEAKAIAERVNQRMLLALGGLTVIAWIAGFAGPVVARVVFP